MMFLLKIIKMEFKEDDEIENYQAKYGIIIESNDIHFDDHPDLGFDYLQYKIKKIKIWKTKKGNNTVLSGIKTTYLNIKTNEIYESDEHMTKTEQKNLEEVEFELKPSEYIIKSSLCFNEGNIFKLSFKTNLRNEFSIGQKVGDEIEVSALQDKKKFVLSFFGTYGKQYLTSIGLFINKNDEFFDYFLKGYFYLKLFLTDESNLSKIENRIKKKELDYNDVALVKACKLPKMLFYLIIKYVSPI